MQILIIKSVQQQTFLRCEIAAKVFESPPTPQLTHRHGGFPPQFGGLIAKNSRDKTPPLTS